MSYIEIAIEEAWVESRPGEEVVVLRPVKGVSLIECDLDDEHKVLGLRLEEIDESERIGDSKLVLYVPTGDKSQMVLGYQKNLPGEVNRARISRDFSETADSGKKK